MPALGFRKHIARMARNLKVRFDALAARYPNAVKGAKIDRDIFNKAAVDLVEALTDFIEAKEGNNGNESYQNHKADYRR